MKLLQFQDRFRGEYGDFMDAFLYNFLGVEIPTKRNSTEIYCISKELIIPFLKMTKDFHQRLEYLQSNGPVPKKSVVGVAAAVVVLLSLFAALAGGCYVMKKKGLLQPLTDVIRRTFMPTKEASTSCDSGLEMQGSKDFRCIRAKHFAEHVRLTMSDSHLQLSQEFEALKNTSPHLPCTVAETEENRSKNRWMNIFPFDHSRVKLLPLCDEPGSDFINANYIPGFSSPREYIASQCPLLHTVDDFWRMVWEQSVTTMVMLTQCVERGKKKCEQYWPEPVEAQYYGDLVVATVSESMLSSYVIRVLHLQLAKHVLLCMCITVSG